MPNAEADAYPQLTSRYVIRREIGRGGMATVYLADDLQHGREVAIKVLLPELSAAIGANRFSREIRTVARLQHPHILPLFDSGEVNGTLFFVMPFVTGESLRDRITREHSLTLEATATIVRQVGDALDYAHGQGLVHRDIKPENILLSEGQALLADFGVARASTNGTLDTITAIGMALGTPAYMSPEQASGDPDVDKQSDLYALGCIVYELLSGSQPFIGANAMATMAQHITRPAPRVVGSRGALSENVVAAVARMLEKEPSQRFASAAEFALALEFEVMAARQPSLVNRQLQVATAEANAKQTVFVLDFANIANAPDVDWLSGGIAETVSVDLQKIGGVRVVGSDASSRQRVAAAKREGPIGPDAARALGRAVSARWVVWGGYQKSGTRVRLTPQFINTETGESFSIVKIDGHMDDIFELQDRIVTQLAAFLNIELTSSEVAHIAVPQTANISAYELYAKGQQEVLIFGKESARSANEYFRRALAIDPNYALAWAGLGGLLMPKYIASGNAADLTDGVTALQNAMQLDPSLSAPYAFLSYMYTQQGNFDEAIRAARTAIEREPSSFFAWYLLALPLLSRAFRDGSLADLARAIPPLLRSRVINPSFHPAPLAAGCIYTIRGQYAHAAPLLDEAVTRELAGTGLKFLGPLVARGIVHARSGEIRAAFSLFDQAICSYPKMDHVYSETMTAWALFSRGRLSEQVRDYPTAQRDYEQGVRIAEANDHRLGIGAQWLKCKLGLSRLAAIRGDIVESDELLLQSTAMLRTRHRFIWIAVAAGATADMLYETASTCALRGETAAAMHWLEEAVRLGWSDAHQLNSDAAFDALRETPVLRQLVTHAASLVTLPPPVGADGFPSLGEESSSSVPIAQAS